MRLNGLATQVFERFPYGLLILDPGGTVVGANRAAEEMLGGALTSAPEMPVRCCDLVGCRDPEGPLAGACVAEAVSTRGERLPEFRVDLADASRSQSSWITAAPLADRGDRVIIELRPGERGDRRRRTDPHWTTGPRLRIRALGQTSVESAEGEIGGDWIGQRPGELLKFLIAKRERPAPTEEIAEAIWPGGEARVVSNVRHYIHSLRARLEPARAKWGESSFIVSRGGGYVLDRDRVDIDVDDFAEHAQQGLASLARGDTAAAKEQVKRAEALYSGDFLADEPFADWAFSERELLRDKASEILRALAGIEIDEGRLAEAQSRLERLASLDPFDSGAQRELLTLCLRRGRKTEALRRYEALRWRLRRHFDEEVGFTLGQLSRELELEAAARRSA